MRISDWSSDVCSSDLSAEVAGAALAEAADVSTAAGLRATDPVALFKAGLATGWQPEPVIDGAVLTRQLAETFARGEQAKVRSEEHTSELQSLMRISYAVFCLKKTTTRNYTYNIA